MPLISGIILRFKRINIIIRNFFLTFIIVSPIFIIWDIFFTAKNYWRFNNEYLIGIYIFKLPIEELLFFFCIPFASIALFELLNLFINDKKIVFNKSLFIILGIFIVLLSFYYNKIYFSTTLKVTSFLILLIVLLKNSVFNSRNFWIFITFSIIPFVIVNFILTSLPVVMYNSEAIENFHIFSIPIEDFFYSFILLSSYLLIYNKIKNRFLLTNKVNVNK